jgi:hypothetical protein
VFIMLSHWCGAAKGIVATIGVQMVMDSERQLLGP